MSLSNNYPDIRPVWMNDYANAGVIDPRCSFARSDSTPSNVHYWSDEDHLSSENLLLQSNTFNTTWASNDVTRTSTASAGPDGSSSAFLIYPNTNSSNARVYQSVTVSSGERGVLSVYAKQSGKTILAIVEQIGTGSLEYSYFDLTDGSDSGSSNHTRIATASGNGYYRCSIALTPNASRTANVFFYVVDAAGSVSATASGTDGIFLFGSQYETLASGGPTVYNATTTQIHREYAATLKSVAYSGQPRFEYEPTGDRSAKGLLMEGQSQNLIPYSSAINSWVTKGNVTITDSAAVGPNGTLSASLVRPTGATSLQHYIRENITTVASSSYTFSAYVKPAGYTKLLLVGEQTAWPYTDYANATFTLTGAGSVTTGAGSATITALSDGWYQITATGTAATTSSYALISVLNDAGDLVYTADSYSGILITAVQYEQNSRQSSYIATSGSASTRTADSLSMTDSSLFDTGSGSLVVEAVVKSLNDGVAAWLGTDGNNYHQVGQFSSTTYPLISKADGVASAVLSSPAVSTGAAHKVGASWDTNDFAACVDGGTVVTDTSGTLPSVNKLTVGNYNAVAAWLDGHVKRVAVYNEALTDTNLQALTS